MMVNGWQCANMKTKKGGNLETGGLIGRKANYTYKHVGCLYFCLHIYLFSFLPATLSTNLAIYLSLFIYQSIYVPAHLCIY